MNTLGGALDKAAKATENTLERVLPQPHGLHSRIHEAMRYATFAGGKRLRPFLVIECAGLFGVEAARASRTAAAIEVLHTYSLVHDDLPAMDNDDLRRGRPTTHKAFDEATAILTGDGLLTIAFEILSHPETHPSAEVRVKLIARLAEAAGCNGMIGGQMIDMVAATRSFDAEEIKLLQRLKTGQLFEFSCEAGAILAEAGPEHQDRLRAFARDMGLVFQITDDLLDVTSTAEKTGKAVGKDQEHGKATLVSIYGIEGARAEAKKISDRAVASLEPYGERAAALRDLLPFLLTRES
ncbi:polyprenyl synthetase family protein [Rhizomicrobium electricum]|jgi:farnesyl diphosphate synthase|uniref:Polyprenyl synthetase family protein n=1 Tax=Rhizomicrobium electricum TaxID=480070 RepID=A0ABN1FAK2_9PROT|nr:farnesyl diphosphate synthase [Rhizomicrobium electricum]NIJ50563.1 farnesyl diphosphate synthase [Rhizomicrobium electricum]